MHAIEMIYRDKQNNHTVRRIQPLEYVDEAAGKVVAWCFLRRELRHFLRGSVMQWQPVRLSEAEEAEVAQARQLLAQHKLAAAEQEARLAATSATLFDQPPF